MFFFHTLAAAFPTSYHIKTGCSRWVWKPSNNACLLKLPPSAPFLTQSDCFEKKTDQSLCVRKEALGTMLMPTKTMVRAIQKNSKAENSKALGTSKVGLAYIEYSAISL